MSAKKIFLIEDNLSILTPLRDRLQEVGFECLTANDRFTIAAEVTRIHPEMVILDIHMKDTDGFGVLEKIRDSTDPLIAKVPVIIGSENGDLVEIARALKLGVVDYYVKSKFDTDLLIEKIKKHIGTPNTPGASLDQLSQTTGVPSVAVAMTKVLIVEDDKFLRDLAMQKLSKEHLQVISAVDGEQGVMLAEKELPDIILLDILLPGIDGFEVLKRVRANPALSKTSIGMLSNFGQREDIEKALATGADQFFIKANFTLDEIVEEVKKMIASPRK